MRLANRSRTVSCSRSGAASSTKMAAKCMGEPPASDDSSIRSLEPTRSIVSTITEPLPNPYEVGVRPLTTLCPAKRTHRSAVRRYALGRSTLCSPSVPAPAWKKRNRGGRVGPVVVTAERASRSTPRTSVWRSPAAYRTGALTLALLSGVIAAAAFPRGPATGTEVAMLMVGCLLVGTVAGWAMRSRWATIVAPALHLAAFETLRFTIFDRPGATLDPPSFDATMGVLLFLVVHVMYVVVAAGPMVLGAIGGAAIARRQASRTSPPPVPRTARRRALSYAGRGGR